MERNDVERWIQNHPETVHCDPKTLLDRCEREVRAHTHHDAWAHAREIAEGQLHWFEQAFGLPASEAFVAKEVSHSVARELRKHEPHLSDADEAKLVADEVLETLDPAAREELRGWLHDLAEKEEHEAWLEVVSFTDHCAKNLIKQAHMSDKAEWDFEHSYTQNAAKVARMLIHEYEAHMQEDEDPSR